MIIYIYGSSNILKNALISKGVSTAHILSVYNTVVLSGSQISFSLFDFSTLGRCHLLNIGMSE